MSNKDTYFSRRMEETCVDAIVGLLIQVECKEFL